MNVNRSTKAPFALLWDKRQLICLNSVPAFTTEFLLFCCLFFFHVCVIFLPVAICYITGDYGITVASGH